MTPWKWTGFVMSDSKCHLKVLGNLHIVNISSCSAFQDFIRDLQVRWDFLVLEKNIFWRFNASFLRHTVNSPQHDTHRRRLLPLHEIPFLCRAAWRTGPPAVRIGHGAYSKHNKSRQGRLEHKPFFSTRDSVQPFSQLALQEIQCTTRSSALFGINFLKMCPDSPRVSRFPQENRDVSCSLVEPVKETTPINKWHNNQILYVQSVLNLNLKKNFCSIHDVSSSLKTQRLHSKHLIGVMDSNRQVGRGYLGVLHCGVRPAGLCAARGRTSSWEWSCWPEGSPERRTRRWRLPSPCESPGWFLVLRC